MTRDIKNITKDREKIEAELNLAKTIQASALPNKFPPYPDRNEFDIYATMVPAKDVGGDFYDFFFIDNDNFMFLIADVSGKGIPAALFMMTVKTLVNNVAQMKHSPKEIFETVNKQICISNQDLFVTLFACIVNTKTGKLTCVNCGHNPPLICQNNKFEYLQTDSNMVLGAFDDTEFNVYETTLKPNDLIFLYTDGVTEAVNENNEMFCEQRLLDALNESTKDNLQSIVTNIKAKLKDFIGNMQQSDDTTMMGFKLNETNKNVYRSKATMEGYKNFRNWMKDVCIEWGLDKETSMKLDLVSEEIFVNILSYGYTDRQGEVEVEFSKSDNEITFKFTDDGIPYNPLEKDDPDIELPPEERPVGGLGIFIVKQSVNDYKYENIDGKNILTLKIIM